jgi:hypothetical protein
MTADQIEREVLPHIDFMGWAFHLGGTGARTWLQASFEAPCATTGQMKRQFTRKWYISAAATRSEIVRTALKLVLTAIEHEVRERFTWRGQAIFGPHIDVEALHLLCHQGAALDEREV